MATRVEVRLALAAAAILATGTAVYVLAFGDADPPVVLPVTPPTPPPPAPAAAPAKRAFDLVEIIGTVEVLRGGVWIAARGGERILASEAIRTSDGASAVLRTASGDELALRERVELSVDLLEGTVTELTLRQGRVRAAPAAATERFQISSAGAQAVAPGGTRFTVFSDPRGAVAVASERGDVKVIAEGEQVTVGERMQTFVAPGQAPLPPGPIPEDVFLAVSWPAGELHAPKLVVRGTARPGTEIQVNGVPVAVQASGVFEVPVKVREGENTVEVVAEGMDGKVRRDQGKVVVNTKGPPLQVDPLRYGDPPPDAKPP